MAEVRQEHIEWLVKRCNQEAKGWLTRIVARRTKISVPKLSRLKRGQKTLSETELNSLVELYENDQAQHRHTGNVGAKSPPVESEASSQIEDPRPDEKTFFVHEIYPEQFITDLERTVRASITGTSLRRLELEHERIREILVRDNTSAIQVLFVDYMKKELCRYAAIQEFGKDNAKTVKRFKDRLKKNAAWWFDLRKEFNERVEIKKIDFPLAFGLDVLEFKAGGGTVYVCLYPLMDGGEEQDKPIVEIRNGDKTWHSFYKKQFERHWKRAAQFKRL